MLATAEPRDTDPEYRELLKKRFTAALRSDFPEHADILIDYAEFRRPEGLDEVDALRTILRQMRLGDIEETVRQAKLEPEVLSLQREIAVALREHLAPLRGKHWRDPKTLREVRRTVKHYLEKRARFARSAEIAALVNEHVRVDIQGRRIFTRTSRIVESLYRAGAF